MDLPTIDGRECVPVRLLPFMTAWRTLSPDVVARLFSRREEFRTWSISTHNLRPDGKHHELLPNAWDQIDDDLTVLAHELNRQEDFQYQKYPEWRRRSVDRLPPSVFVWRDDLVAQYADTFGRQAYPNLRPGAGGCTEEEAEAEAERIIRLCSSPDTSEEADAAIEKFMQSVERDTVYRLGDGALNFEPLLSAEEELVAFEGFAFALGSSRPMCPLAASAAPLASLGVSAAPEPQLVHPMLGEAPEDRQDRRLQEFKTMGSDYVEVDGSWRSKGPRGNLAKLARSEKAAGRPMSDEKDVREDLKKAARRFADAKAAEYMGNSAFNP